jgi:Tfp pilus assembly protein PilO
MTRRDRLVIVGVVIVAAIAASWFMLISPKRDQASKLGAKVTAAQGQLDSARSELAQNAAASKQYATNYAALARLGQAIPATDQVPSLIFELQSAADGARVDFQGLQNGTNSTTGAASTAPTTPGATAGTAAPDTFSFTFSGSYFQLSNFFDRLQRFVVANGNGVLVHGRLITLNTVNLVPASGGFPQINAMITATTYTEPAPQVSSAGAASSAAASAPGGAQPASTTSPSTTPAPAAAISSPIR